MPGRLRRLQTAECVIEYRFVRRRRRTLAIAVDASGVTVSAPMRAPWRDIESFLRDKERWLIDKVREWSQVPRPARIAGASGEVLPLFGRPVVIEAQTGRRAVRLEGDRLVVRAAGPGGIVQVLAAWLKATALEALPPRAAHFASMLGLAPPPVKLSRARHQWGVCVEDGSIRLNWRLVHLEPALADYVAAHEVAHLVELNHSRRFWKVVESLYPDWRGARERLELAGAALPILATGPRP